MVSTLTRRLCVGILAGAVWSLIGSGIDLRVAQAESFSADETKAFIERMRVHHNFDSVRLRATLGHAEVLQSVLEAMSRPAEGKPWYIYRKIFIKPLRIERGVDFFVRHRSTLEQAQREFGVPAEVIVAIIGVETLYGEYRGRYRVLDSLATLGFRYPRRSKFFSTELEHFFLLAREEGMDPLKITGSYAGAMGIPQFIASSYRSYAVDFDGDGVRDLLGSVDDAIGSVANYLKRHGWRRYGLIAVPVQVKGPQPRALLDLGLKPKATINEIKSHGVQVYESVPDEEKGALLEFELRDGVEYWVGLDNFYAITRYNHSALYAMAVFQLSEAILKAYQESP